MNPPGLRDNSPQFSSHFYSPAILTNFRLTRFKWLEPVLLILSLLVLLATYSRGGLLTTVAAAGLTFLFLGRDVIR